MTEAIIVALITGCLSVLGVVVTQVFTTKRSNQSINTSLAVMETEVKELTREVRLHNSFAERIPTLETKIDMLDKRVSKIESKKN